MDSLVILYVLAAIVVVLLIVYKIMKKNNEDGTGNVETFVCESVGDAGKGMTYISAYDLKDANQHWIVAFGGKEYFLVPAELKADKLYHTKGKAFVLPMAPSDNLVVCDGNDGYAKLLDGTKEYELVFVPEDIKGRCQKEAVKKFLAGVR